MNLNNIIMKYLNEANVIFNIGDKVKFKSDLKPLKGSNLRHMGYLYGEIIEIDRFGVVSIKISQADDGTKVGTIYKRELKGLTKVK